MLVLHNSAHVRGPIAGSGCVRSCLRASCVSTYKYDCATLDPVIRLKIRLARVGVGVCLCVRISRRMNHCAGRVPGEREHQPPS